MTAMLDHITDPLTQDRAEIQSSIESIASIASYRWRRILPRERLIEELWDWAEDHAGELETVYQRADDLAHARSTAHVVLRRACYRLVRTMLSFYAPSLLADIRAQADYESAFIEKALPSIWMPIDHFVMTGALDLDPEMASFKSKADPSHRAEVPEWLHDLHAAYAQLTNRQQIVLEMLINDDESQERVAEVLGVSQPRVSQIKNAALERLAKLMNGDEQNVHQKREAFRRAKCAA